MIFPLRLKLALAISVLLGIALVTAALLVLRQSTHALEQEARKRGTWITSNLARNARVPLLEQDDVVLAALLETVAQEAEILGARFVDRNGKVIAATGSQLPWAGRLLAEGEELRSQAVGGDLLIGARISFHDVRIAEAQVLIDLDGLIAPLATRARNDVAVAAGALLVIGIGLAFSISARTTRPLRRLRLAVNALAAGDLSARVTPTTRDEVADLTRAFNAMGESLSQKHRVEKAFRRYVSDHVLREVIDSPESISLSGEKRVISVIFIDIRNFTRLTTRLGPERLVSFLNESFALITSRLLEHGATVDKYIGDAILAYFGAPIETPDHAERAVAAAVAIQRSIQQRNQRGENDSGAFVRLEVGIGIHSGPVVVGNIGSELKMDYTAIGDPVNVANRLQNLAKPGEILVTADVAFPIQGRVALDSLGPQKIAGKDTPMEVYRVRL